MLPSLSPCSLTSSWRCSYITSLDGQVSLEIVIILCDSFQVLKTINTVKQRCSGGIRDRDLQIFPIYHLKYFYLYLHSKGQILYHHQLCSKWQKKKECDIIWNSRCLKSLRVLIQTLFTHQHFKVKVPGTKYRSLFRS